MKKLFHSIFLSIICVLLFSCQENVHRILNDPKDVAKANELTTNFYKLLIKKDSVEIFNFKSLQEASEFKKAINIKDSILGSLLNYKIEEIVTNRVEINDSLFIEYLIKLKVENMRGNTSERIGFTSDINNKTYLDNYHYSIDDFK